MSRPQKIIPPIKGEFQGIINAVADGKGMPPKAAEKRDVTWVRATQNEINWYCALVNDARETFETILREAALSPLLRKEAGKRVKELRSVYRELQIIKDEIIKGI